MIVGLGIDVVPVERFAAALARTAGMAERLFTPTELVTGQGLPRAADSLAARFAAKEALAKALGAPSGLAWHDAAVAVDGSGRPTLSVSGTVAAAGERLGVRHWHVSMSHDGGIASAVVVIES